ncbi:hypothetical protein ACXXCT_08600 [Bordetella bronchiseptica]
MPTLNRQQRRQLEQQRSRQRAQRRVERPAKLPMLIKAQQTLAPLELIWRRGREPTSLFPRTRPDPFGQGLGPDTFHKRCIDTARPCQKHSPSTDASCCPTV